MITGNERREVAARIRERLREGKDKYLDALIGNAMSGCVPDGMTFGQTVADLIDPTCYLVGTTREEGLYEPTVFRYELSCGHTCHTDCPEPTAYCYECGCRVVL